MKKRTLCLLLLLVLTLALLAIPAFAESEVKCINCNSSVGVSRVDGKYFSNGSDGHRAAYACSGCLFNDKPIKFAAGETLPHTLFLKSEGGKYWSECSECGYQTYKSTVPPVTCRRGHTDVTRMEGRYATNFNDVYHYPVYTCNTCASYTTEAYNYFYDKSTPVPHTFTWEWMDGAYVQMCKICDYYRSSSRISLTIQGADRVCVTQKYTYSFTLPAGITDFETGYEAPMKGGELSATEENGVYTVEMEPEWYDDSSSTFVVSVIVRTADGTPLKFEKTVTLLASHVEGTAATCTTPAVCAVCGVSYGDVDPENHTGTAQWSITPTRHGKLYDCCSAVAMADAPHNWENGVCKDCSASCRHDGGEATCTAPATCAFCGLSYGDVAPNNHALKHVEAKEATVDAAGNTEYWTCERCGKCFASKEAVEELAPADTVIPKKEPEKKPEKKPEKEPEKKPEKEPEKKPEPEKKTEPKETDAPKTGDKASPVLWAALLLAAGVGMAAVGLTRKKKHETE